MFTESYKLWHTTQNTFMHAPWCSTIGLDFKSVLYSCIAYTIYIQILLFCLWIDSVITHFTSDLFMRLNSKEIPLSHYLLKFTQKEPINQTLCLEWEKLTFLYIVFRKFGNVSLYIMIHLSSWKLLILGQPKYLELLILKNKKWRKKKSETEPQNCLLKKTNSL